MVELKYFDGTCSTAGPEVFTISCPEAVGKHCNSWKKQNTSISVVIVPLSHVNKNSVALDGIALIFWVEWLTIREMFDCRTRSIYDLLSNFTL